MFDGMPMVNAIFPTWEDLGSKLVLWSKTFAQNIGDEYHVDISKFKWSFCFKFQKNINCWNQNFKIK